MPRIVIFANGVLADPDQARRLVAPSDVVLCADGGTRHALALGIQPSLIIGDLDSLAPSSRKMVGDAGISIQPHPHDKDETDLELALHEAVAQDPSGILILAGLGRRLDHTLGNIAILTDPALAALDVRLDDGLEEVFFCRGQAEVRGAVGDIVSLLPWGGPVAGIHTEGLKWPLRDETLYEDRTRGISNEMLAAAAHVHIRSGRLLIIHRRQTQAEDRALKG